jgi:hypothetical protein
MVCLRRGYFSVNLCLGVGQTEKKELKTGEVGGDTLYDAQKHDVGHA